MYLYHFITLTGLSACVLASPLTLMSNGLPEGLDHNEAIVVPGPGLPSPESLNITVTDLLLDPEEFVSRHPELVDGLLWARTAISPATTSPSALFRRDPAVCCGSWGSIFGAQICYNYLLALGTTPCVANKFGTTMCSRNYNGVTTVVQGFAVNGLTSTQSYCSDVAFAVQDVWSHCTDSNGNTCGSQRAYGNGNLDVFVWLG